MKTKAVFRKDILQTKALVKAGKIASDTANRASRALGISVTYIKDGVIYEETSEGVITTKKQIEDDVVAPFEIKKGLILHAK
ncbi:hypothetical protein B6A10_06235 [Flavobacterium sp. L1I52]|uniref:Uncharacterized protein n=1 Tax=Flavobacterium pokkalii TaxID=1940408 RepID=A0ABR7URA2_9FLAO|nr:hypothetical protein [Flavobacterium pokkalii]MBD0724773.1 hypothetical protein [Flavobacterium pokkalii]